MARLQRTKFGGLNTDLPASKLPSGTAREAVNVTLRDGRLAKRYGFSEFEDKIDGSSTAIIGMWIAKFKAGTYVVVKLSTGRYWQRKTDADLFTIIANTNGWTHANERGFAFLWNDRFICGDSGGVSQWNPGVGSGVMLKAGLPMPNQALTLSEAAGGAKNGFYHCHLSFYNANLDVESVVSYPYKALVGGPVETRIADKGGGIVYSGAITTPTGYEATHSRTYTTMGNTEYIESGGETRETFSYRAAIDNELAFAAGLDGTPGMSKADESLDWSNGLFTNEGGQPPPATLGAWSGAVAVYGGFTKMYVGGPTITGDMVVYSKFGRPTMVPLPITYAQANKDSVTDYRMVHPRGGHHMLPSPCDGAVVEIVAAGGTIVLYTAASTWVMRSAPDGKLYAVRRKDGIGCVGHPAAAAFGFEAHAMGYRAWTITTAQTFTDIAQNKFAAVLAEIPVAQQSDAVMASFESQGEVWCAVTQSDQTIPQRILVLDESRELVIYEPATDMWMSGEYISAMCELAHGAAEPTMLLATNKGRILQYDATKSDDDGHDFAASWKGVFATERAAYGQRLEKVEIHTGDYCRERVGWEIAAVRATGETGTPHRGRVPADNAICTCNIPEKQDARFWEVKIESAAVGDGDTATTWDINDIILQIGRT